MEDLPILIMKAFEVAALYAVLSLAQRLLQKRIKVLSYSPIALNVLFLLISINLFLINTLAEFNASVLDWNMAALLFVSAYLGIKTMDFFFFDIFLRKRRKAPVPLVLRDIFRWVLSTLALFVVIRTIFPAINLNVLAVSSIVTGYVVGNATQETLGNLIAGLALNTEAPFMIGDWVEVAGHTGRVVDMTWRATCLRTKTDDYIIIPNDAIARESIINYSRPTSVHGYLLDVGVNYEVPPNKVRGIILSVLDKNPEVLKKPEPCVWLVKYNDFSIDYKIKFYIRDFEKLEHIESRIMDHIWYSFKRNGIVIPFPIRDVRLHQVDAGEERRRSDEELRGKAELFAGIDIFKPLSPEEHLMLAREMREEIYAEGELVLRQGDSGSTFYIIRSGEVAVSIKRDKRDVRVARLVAGDFFGEMSFLTGEKCNATVTAVTDVVIAALPHTVLGSILESSENLAEEMANVLERRMKSGEGCIDQANAIDVIEQQPVQSQDFLHRIRKFFGLDKT